MEHAIHRAERLREIVNDAVQQDFFLLNFFDELFVLEKGIAGGLEPRLLPCKCLRKTANDQYLFSIEQVRGGFQGRFFRGVATLDPIAGIE